MVISSKGRYALRVMVYLAVNHSDDYIPLKEISQKEDLSQKYLETITRMLSKAHLIEAASGHGGGYRLTRNPADYSISEILNLTEGSVSSRFPVLRMNRICVSVQVPVIHFLYGKDLQRLSMTTLIIWHLQML